MAAVLKNDAAINIALRDIGSSVNSDEQSRSEVEAREQEERAVAASGDAMGHNSTQRLEQVRRNSKCYE
jgi:hypothetical protein